MRATGTRSILTATAAALLVLAAAVGSAPAAPSATTWSASDVRVTPPSQPDDIGRYETNVAIDPADPNVMVAGVIDLNWQLLHPGTYSNVRVYRSEDGGATWADLGWSPSGDSGDPQLLFDSLGNLYSATVGELGMSVARSTDGGHTWSAPVVLDPYNRDRLAPDCGAADKEEIAIDRRTDTLYAVWSHFEVGCFHPRPEGDRTFVVMSRSTDRGVTWSAPVRIGEPGASFALGAAPAVAPDGTLHVTWFDQREIRSPLDCPSGYAIVSAAVQRNVPPQLTEDIVVATSEDGGATWRYHRQNICETITATIVNRYTRDGTYVTASLPAIAVEPATGAAVVTWTAASLEGRLVLQSTRSTDGGMTWSAAETLAAGDDDLSFPSLAGDAGRVWLQYRLSRRDGTADFFVRESLDGGATFGDPVRLTSESTRGKDTDVGDYQWIAASGGRVVASWTDHRVDPGPNSVYVRTGTY